MCRALTAQDQGSTPQEQGSMLPGQGQHRATLYSTRQYTYGSVQCNKLLPVRPIQGSAMLNPGSAVLNQASTMLRSMLPGSVHLHLSIHQFAVCLHVQGSTALDQGSTALEQGSTVLHSTPRGSTELDQGSTVQDQAVIHQALDTTTQFWDVSSQKQMSLPEEGQVCCAFSPAIQSSWTVACRHFSHHDTAHINSHHIISCHALLCMRSHDSVSGKSSRYVAVCTDKHGQ